MAYLPRTSDEAVKRATGKTWSQWFALLDRAGAKEMKHADVARVLYKKYFDEDSRHGSNVVVKNGSWWSQMVTVEYERSRGVRKMNQVTSGFTVSIHRTFEVGVSTLFADWRRFAKSRGLKEKTLRKNKYIRYLTASERPAYLAVFAAKGTGRSRLAFEVQRLQHESDVLKERVRWKRELEWFRGKIQ